jgi:hypothetical protein
MTKNVFSAKDIEVIQNLEKFSDVCEYLKIKEKTLNGKIDFWMSPSRINESYLRDIQKFLDNAKILDEENRYPMRTVSPGYTNKKCDITDLVVFYGDVIFSPLICSEGGVRSPLSSSDPVNERFPFNQHIFQESIVPMLHNVGYFVSLLASEETGRYCSNLGFQLVVGRELKTEKIEEKNDNQVIITKRGIESILSRKDLMSKLLDEDLNPFAKITKDGTKFRLENLREPRKYLFYSQHKDDGLRMSYSKPKLPCLRVSEYLKREKIDLA